MRSTAAARPWISTCRKRVTAEAAKIFLKRALANRDNRPPHVFAREIYAVIRQPSETCIVAPTRLARDRGEG